MSVSFSASTLFPHLSLSFCPPLTPFLSLSVSHPHSDFLSPFHTLSLFPFLSLALVVPRDRGNAPVTQVPQLTCPLTGTDTLIRPLGVVGQTHKPSMSQGAEHVQTLRHMSYSIAIHASPTFGTLNTENISNFGTFIKIHSCPL